MNSQTKLVLLFTTLTAIGLSLYLVSSQSQKQQTIPSAVYDTFSKWKTEHKRRYLTPEEHSHRLKIFYQNVLKIQKLQKVVSYKVGLTQFSDLTEEEFIAKYTGILPEHSNPDQNFQRTTHKITKNVKDLPEEVDWRAKGAVNPIRNQGGCGSCWAFSVVQTIESAYYNKFGTLPQLSEQQLVDCTVKAGNHGCKGGWLDRTFQYIWDNKGLASEQNYPYTGWDDWCSDWETQQVKFETKNIIDIPQSNLAALADAVAQNPVSAVVRANAFQHYVSGVFDDPDCGTRYNHAIGVVGFGVEEGSGKEFWIVRNSWGEVWGENGYIRMRKDTENPKGECGIGLGAAYVVLN